MNLKRFTNYLLQHRAIAVLLTFAITFIPVLGLIGVMIATLMTLCKGMVQGAIFMVAATLPYVINFFVLGDPHAAVPLVAWAVLGVAGISNFLTWVFAVMLNRKASWSLIIQVAALLGVLVVSIIHLLYPNIADWWATQLQSYYELAQSTTTAVKSAATTTAQTPTAADLQLETISETKQYATGIMAAAILLTAVSQLIAARWWQVLVFKPGTLRQELRNIRLSQLAGLLFVFSLGLAYFGNVVVLDIMPIVYVLFTAVGLSLVHYWFGLLNSPTTWFWIAVFYCVMIFSIPTSIFLISLLALFDIWFDLRKRFRKT